MVKKTQKKEEATEKKGKSRIGNKYVCGVCGLSVIVNEDCCCKQDCDIECCNEQMVLC